MLRRFRPICEYHETDGYPMAVMIEIDSGEYVLFADYKALEKENSDLLAQCGGMEMTINELTEDLKIARDNSWEAREFGSTPSEGAGE